MAFKLENIAPPNHIDPISYPVISISLNILSGIELAREVCLNIHSHVKFLVQIDGIVNFKIYFLRVINTACHSHAVPVTCPFAKGLDCVCPI
jgi:hypothetical protein